MDLSKVLAYTVAVLALFVADCTQFSLISKTKLVHDILELNFTFYKQSKSRGSISCFPNQRSIASRAQGNRG